VLPKKHRLTRSADFGVVHDTGHCWSSRMIVVCQAPNELTVSRFGFSVSKRVGNAVVRNRTKRLLREVVRLHLDLLAPGWDVVLIARRAIVGASYTTVETAVLDVFRLAKLCQNADDESVRVWS